MISNQNVLEELKPILEKINEAQSVELDFEGEIKKVPVQQKVTGYLADEIIEILNSQDPDPMLTLLRELRKKLGDKFDNDENIKKYLEENPHKYYTFEDIQKWTKNRTHFVDKGKIYEKTRITIEIIKKILDRTQLNQNEIKLIDSEWSSEFWKKQDRKGMEHAVAFFRGQTSI